MNLLDFQTVLDFSGLPSIQGQDINNGLDALIPQKEADEAEGRGLLIVSTDTALNIPNVPPIATGSFKRFARFAWIRRPFAGAADKTGKLYYWNDDGSK